MITLQVIWVLLIGILIIGYAILDGFDLGVGCWVGRYWSERYRTINLRRTI